MIDHPDLDENTHYARDDALAELAFFETNQVSVKDEYATIEHDGKFTGCHDIYHLSPRLLFCDHNRGVIYSSIQLYISER